MKHQITHISYRQTAKIVALLSALFSEMFFIVLVLVLLVARPELLNDAVRIKRVAITAFTLPLFSALLSYLGTLLCCFFYNQLTKYIGGIEITLDSKDA